MELIGGKKCTKCNIGEYHFSNFVIKRKDVGQGTKFLQYSCNICGHEFERPYMIDKKPKQLKFNV